MGGIRNLYDDWSYGVLALLLYAQRGSDKYKPEGMARIRINEAELDNTAFQVKTIEMIVEAFCIIALCREWGQDSGPAVVSHQCHRRDSMLVSG